MGVPVVKGGKQTGHDDLESLIFASEEIRGRHFNVIKLYVS